jgi:hypothetical protein
MQPPSEIDRRHAAHGECRVNESFLDIPAADLAGGLFSGRCQDYVDGVSVLLGDLGSEAELHADEGDAEVHSAAGRLARYHLKDQLNRRYLQVCGLRGAGHARPLTESLTTLIRVSTGTPSSVTFMASSP